MAVVMYASAGVRVHAFSLCHGKVYSSVLCVAYHLNKQRAYHSKLQCIDMPPGKRPIAKAHGAHISQHHAWRS